MTDIYLSGIKKAYNGNTILNNIDLFLPSGSFNVLTGPNGSGKTTLVEIIAGIVQPSSGNIFIGNIKVNSFPPFNRKVFYIPQSLQKYWSLIDPRLYCFIPNMTIKENIIAALRSSGKIIEIDSFLDNFDLTDYVDEMPNHLSHGLQQRLALARAFLNRPNIILMDEPLSSIDIKMKPQLIEIIKKVHKENITTILYVTHDNEEAKMYEASNYFINKGQIGKSQTFYGFDINADVKLRNTRLNTECYEKEEKQWNENNRNKAANLSDNFRDLNNKSSGQASLKEKGLLLANQKLMSSKTSENDEYIQSQFMKYSQQLENLTTSSLEITKAHRDIFDKMKQLIKEMHSKSSNQNSLKKIESKEMARTAIKKVADFTSFKSPLYIAWETTHKCNASCIHCYSNSSPEVNCDNDLSTEEALDLIDQLTDAGLMVLAFSGGEPMIRKDWRILAERAKKNGLAVNIGTNGSCINSHTADELKEIGVHSVTVSLDSHLSTIHDRIRQIDGLFWQAIKAVLLLVDRGVRVVVGFTPIKLNWADGGEVIELAYQLGANAVNLSNYVPAGRGSISIDLRPEELRKILAEWIEYRKKYKGQLEVIWHDCRVSLLAPDEEKRDYLGCGAGRFVARILPDGIVTPCFFLPIPIGSIRENSFQKIWRESELLLKFRERSGYILGNCKDCEHLQICGGCRSVAYAYSKKDPLAGDPHCWIITDDDSYMAALAEGAGLPY